ncbi:MAG: CpsD/CapB family tyrosine-protein kinase, partial [Pygmaiobacter sp.]
PPNPTEILASEKMEKLVTELSKRYDYIIFDTPPVSVVTDAAVLGRLADGALLVIRQKFATSEAVRAAKQNLESVGVHVIGAVLSRFDYKTLSKDRGYYATYEYNYVQHAGTDS